MLLDNDPLKLGFSGISEYSVRIGADSRSALTSRLVFIILSESNKIVIRQVQSGYQGKHFCQFETVDVFFQCFLVKREMRTKNIGFFSKEKVVPHDSVTKVASEINTFVAFGMLWILLQKISILDAIGGASLSSFMLQSRWPTNLSALLSFS